MKATELCPQTVSFEPDLHAVFLLGKEDSEDG